MSSEEVVKKQLEEAKKMIDEKCSEYIRELEKTASEKIGRT